MREDPAGPDSPDRSPNLPPFPTSPHFGPPSYTPPSTKVNSGVVGVGKWRVFGDLEGGEPTHGREGRPSGGWYGRSRSRSRARPRAAAAAVPCLIRGSIRAPFVPFEPGGATKTGGAAVGRRKVVIVAVIVTVTVGHVLFELAAPGRV